MVCNEQIFMKYNCKKKVVRYNFLNSQTFVNMCTKCTVLFLLTTENMTVENIVGDCFILFRSVSFRVRSCVVYILALCNKSYILLFGTRTYLCIEVTI